MEHTIFLVGLTGAGKTTTGEQLSRLLEWKFIDLDQELETEMGLKCPDISRKLGWAEFRKREALALEKLMDTCPYKHVVSCGGGVVETQRARTLLKRWHSKGLVLLVRRRDAKDLITELHRTDTKRMITKENLNEIFERRIPWLEQCSNCCYINDRMDLGASDVPLELQQIIEQLQADTKVNDSTIEDEERHAVR